MTELERRDLVVSGAVQRHQMRQWLNASGVEWVEEPSPPRCTFRITATSDQWKQINEWVERTKETR